MTKSIAHDPTSASEGTARIERTRDIPVCVDLRIEFQVLMGGPLEPEFEARLREANRLHLERGFAEESTVVWIAKVGTEIAGCVMLQEQRIIPNRSVPNGRTGLVLNLHVRDGFRRRGIGERLMREVEAGGRALGLGRLELQATEMGEGIYRRMGWKDPHGGTALELTLEVPH